MVYFKYLRLVECYLVMNVYVVMLVFCVDGFVVE